MINSKPDLQNGINLVRSKDDDLKIQPLIARELQQPEEKGVWIDSINSASTYTLSSAGSGSLLEKLWIARSYTVFQHHTAVNQLENHISQDTDLLVFSGIDFLYSEAEIKKWEAIELFKETWCKIRSLQEELEIKVLVTCSNIDSKPASIVAGDSDKKIGIEQTTQGIRYSSNCFTQKTYRHSGSVQTTIPLWKQKSRPESKVSAEVYSG